MISLVKETECSASIAIGNQKKHRVLKCGSTYTHIISNGSRGLHQSRKKNSPFMIRT